jgi:hypothetical protein
MWGGPASAGNAPADERSYLRPNVPVTDAERLEVAMSPTATTLEQLDCDISVAHIALGVARGSWHRCPSPENARLVDEAESSVNRLLDERFAALR